MTAQSKPVVDLRGVSPLFLLRLKHDEKLRQDVLAQFPDDEQTKNAVEASRASEWAYVHMDLRAFHIDPTGEVWKEAHQKLGPLPPIAAANTNGKPTNKEISDAIQAWILPLDWSSPEYPPDVDYNDMGSDEADAEHDKDPALSDRVRALKMVAFQKVEADKVKAIKAWLCSQVVTELALHFDESNIKTTARDENLQPSPTLTSHQTSIDSLREMLPASCHLLVDCRTGPGGIIRHLSLWAGQQPRSSAVEGAPPGHKLSDNLLRGQYDNYKSIRVFLRSDRDIAGVIPWPLEDPDKSWTFIVQVTDSKDDGPAEPTLQHIFSPQTRLLSGTQPNQRLDINLSFHFVQSPYKTRGNIKRERKLDPREKLACLLATLPYSNSAPDEGLGDQDPQSDGGRDTTASGQTTTKNGRLPISAEDTLADSPLAGRPLDLTRSNRIDGINAALRESTPAYAIRFTVNDSTVALKPIGEEPPQHPQATAVPLLSSKAVLAFKTEVVLKRAVWGLLHSSIDNFHSFQINIFVDEPNQVKNKARKAMQPNLAINIAGKGVPFRKHFGKHILPEPGDKRQTLVRVTFNLGA